jgi:predicted Zn-dependent protease
MNEISPDRWQTALHVFDEPHEETVAERWVRAELFFEARDYVEAAKLLAEVVAEVPNQTGARLLLARAYYHSARLRRAEEQLREVVDRDPVEHYAHLMLGRTLERQGRHDEAAPWLRMADLWADSPQGTEFDESPGAAVEVSGNRPR